MIDTKREDRGFILVMNKETMKWEVWDNEGDRGAWKYASLYTTKFLANKILQIIKEDHYKRMEDARS